MNTVNIVMSSSKDYINHTVVAVLSIIENSNYNYNYDINILHTDIPKDIQTKILSQLNNYKNFKINFLNIDEKIKELSFKTMNHISKETYYRILSPYLFKDKGRILYLDSDIVLNDDIEKLFNEDLMGKILGATYDIDFIGQYSIDYSAIRYYSDKILKIKNPYSYFQAGVLIIDTDRFCDKYNCNHLLEFATAKKYKLADQDVFNILFCDEVHFFSQQWNMVTDCNNIRIKKSILKAPKNLQKEYFEARSSPKIIHYSGDEKPWINKNMDFAKEYKKYSQKVTAEIYNEPQNRNNIINKFFKKFTFLLLPQLSPQREFFKKIYYKKIYHKQYKEDLK